MKNLKFIVSITLTLLLLVSCNTTDENNSTNILESEIPEATIEVENTMTPTLTLEEDDEPVVNIMDDELTDYITEVKNMIVEIEPFGSAYKMYDVDYGTLDKVTYYSQTAERDTNVNILLPAGYSENEKYPVLYILHGYWGNEDSMLDSGDSSLKIPQIIGNLVSNGEAEKMIVVFPYIYTSNTQKTVTGMDLANSLNYDNFINDLVNDLMPFVETNYSAATGRENTAVTGFSMGGRESLFIGFTRPDLFGYIGAVCPAPGLTPGDDLNLHPGQLQESELLIKEGEDIPYLIMISAALNDGVVGNSPEKYHDILIENNVDHVWNLITNGDHGGRGIRPHIYNFAKAIFKAD